MEVCWKFNNYFTSCAMMYSLHIVIGHNKAMVQEWKIGEKVVHLINVFVLEGLNCN